MTMARTRWIPMATTHTLSEEVPSGAVRRRQDRIGNFNASGDGHSRPPRLTLHVRLDFIRRLKYETPWRCQTTPGHPLYKECFVAVRPVAIFREHEDERV